MTAEVSGYKFKKANSTLIEVFDVRDDEFPQSFIRVKPGDLVTEKQFHMEIMDWVSKNVK